MSLQRYEHYYAGMDETPDGEYVLLADVLNLLDTLRCPANGVEHDCTDDLGGYNVDELINLIKGENK